MSRGEYDYLCKVILVGESGAGKTSVLGRFTDDVFTESFLSTIGVDFRIKTVQLSDGKVMKMQVWDTSGQERFRSITQSYYRGAHAAIIVYDISSIDSFRAVPGWLEGVMKHCSESVLVMLLGNKSDLAFKRQVHESVVQEFVEEHKIPLFYEVSAKSGSNVEEAFLTMAERHQLFLQKTESAVVKDPIGLGNSLLLLEPKKTPCCG